MFPEKNKNALKNGRQIDTYLAKYFNKKKTIKIAQFLHFILAIASLTIVGCFE